MPDKGILKYVKSTYRDLVHSCAVCVGRIDATVDVLEVRQFVEQCSSFGVLVPVVPCRPEQGAQVHGVVVGVGRVHVGECVGAGSAWADVLLVGDCNARFKLCKNLTQALHQLAIRRNRCGLMN